MKTLNQILILLLILLVPAVVSAQGPAMKWFFGNQAGLDFTNGTPVPVTNGQMQAYEGASVAANAQGELLFYTNGGSLPYAGGVWNRNHQLMPNGNLSNAGGCNSSIQSALILPRPETTDMFYMFTTDCIENNFAGGLRYSIIDMNLDGGLGDVVVKGVQLTKNINESLTAVAHPEGKGYWIITSKLNTDSFYVYHLVYDGIISLVKSKAGPSTGSYAGTIIPSSNGQRLVYSMHSATGLMDFDPLTGKISNYIDLNHPSYTAVFSPDCQYLFTANAHSKQIHQFDLSVENPAPTKSLIGTTASTGVGTMQIGPDGKIYVARYFGSQYLGVINNPNYKGTASNYVDNGLYLQGKTSNVGLPNFANSFVGTCSPYIHQPTLIEDIPGQVKLQADIEDVNSTSIKVKWNHIDKADSYKLMVKNTQTGEITNFESDIEEVLIENLKPNTNYQVLVYPEFEETNVDANYTPVDHYFARIMFNNDAYVDAPSIVQAKTADNLSVSVFPNPVKDLVRLTVIGAEENVISIKITDLSGRVVKQFDADIFSNNTIRIPITELSNGIYQVVVNTSHVQKAEKLIVLK